MTGPHPGGEALSSYLDGDIPEARRGELDTHLALCPACRSEMGALEAVRRVLSSAPNPPVPAGFLEGLDRRLWQSLERRSEETPAAEPVAGGAWFGALAPWAVAAAAAVFAALWLGGLRNGFDLAKRHGGKVPEGRLAGVPPLPGGQEGKMPTDIVCRSLDFAGDSDFQSDAVQWACPPGYLKKLRSGPSRARPAESADLTLRPGER